MTILSRLLSAVLTLHVAFAFAGKTKPKTYDPLVIEAMNWEKKVPSLEKVLKRNGWWTTAKVGGMGPNMLALENVKFTEPFTLVVKGRGIASFQTKNSIEYIGHNECLQGEKIVAGSKRVFKYDKKTERASCWIKKPLAENATKEIHSYTVIRSVMKGSSAYRIESAEITLDRQRKKDVHPLAQKIAQQVGAQ
jgi:hypothetical protein